jgi:hypothetical protein
MAKQTTILPPDAIPVESEGMRLPPPGPEERAIMRELEVPKILEGLNSRIEELRPRVEVVQEEAGAEAALKLGEAIELKELRKGGLILRDIWQAHDAEAEKVLSDARLSDEGRSEELAKIEARRDARIRGQRERLLGLADGLVRENPKERAPSLTAEVGTRATLLASQFPQSLPEDFLSEALGELDAASSPERSEREKAEAALTLRWAFLPLLKRRATYPERFAEPFQEAYRSVVELAEGALDSGHANRTAQELRERFVNAWDSVVRICRQNKTWDFTLASILGSFFDWSE